MKRVLGNVATTLVITVVTIGILFGVAFGVYTWTAKDTEREFNNGVCNVCEVGTYEFTNASEDTRGDITYFYSCDRCGHTIDLEMQMITEPTANTMTVDEFVSLPGDFYYIVKAEGDFGVLESDVYMDREVVEVAVCEDTENTICLFIQLEENEEPHYRKVN